MPAPVQEVLVYPATARIRISLEPAFNSFHSLLLLAKTEEIGAFSDWVTETMLSMSALERQRHRLVMIGFFFAVMPERSWPSWPAYIDHLASLSPLALRDKLLEAYFHLSCQESTDERSLDDASAVLASEEDYLAFLRSRFSEDHVDPELETQAYAYVVDPPAMKSLIVSHLSHMWEAYLEAEWERIRPMLQDAVAAFSEVDFTPMSQLEVARFVTDQTLSDPHLIEMIGKSERLVFVPSAHVGHYLGKFKIGSDIGIVFGARLPEGTHYVAPDLSRAEILVRLSALADETRLRILRLVADEGEKRSQEIMLELDLSQSATSRHLTQLSATGYLTERRCEGAKCYAINKERVEETLNAVVAYLNGA